MRFRSYLAPILVFVFISTFVGGSIGYLVSHHHLGKSPYTSISTDCWNAKVVAVKLRDGHILADISCPTKGA